VDNTRCIPHQESGSSIGLRFEVFAQASGVTAVAVTPPAPPRLFAYPKQGQTAAQHSKDRSECEASAAAQSGWDPSAPAGTGKAAAGEAYTRALAACLEGRGYSIR
jgi:hypothetical protein